MGPSLEASSPPQPPPATVSERVCPVTAADLGGAWPCPRLQQWLVSGRGGGSACTDPKASHESDTSCVNVQSTSALWVPLLTRAACLPALSREAQGWDGLHSRVLEKTLLRGQRRAQAGGMPGGSPGGVAVPPHLWTAARARGSPKPPWFASRAQACGCPPPGLPGRGGAEWRKRTRRTPEEVSAYTRVFFLIPIVQLSEVCSAELPLPGLSRSWPAGVASGDGDRASSPPGRARKECSWSGRVTLGQSFPALGPAPWEVCCGPGEWTAAAAPLMQAGGWRGPCPGRACGLAGAWEGDCPLPCV